MGALIAALPDNSATVQKLVPSALWSLEAHLLASLVEQTDALRKQIVALLADPKKLNRSDLKPLVIRRPGMPSKYERRGTTLGQLQAMVGTEPVNGD